MKRVCFYLSVANDDLMKLLDLGLYNQVPELCIDRKRIIDFRKEIV